MKIVHLRSGWTICFYKDFVRWMQIDMHYNLSKGYMEQRIVVFIVTGLILASSSSSTD